MFKRCVNQSRYIYGITIFTTLSLALWLNHPFLPMPTFQCWQWEGAGTAIQKRHFFLREKYPSVTNTCWMNSYINIDGLDHFSCFPYLVDFQNSDLVLMGSVDAVLPLTRTTRCSTFYWREMRLVTHFASLALASVVQVFWATGKGDSIFNTRSARRQSVFVCNTAFLGISEPLTVTALNMDVLLTQNENTTRA